MRRPPAVVVMATVLVVVACRQRPPAAARPDRLETLHEALSVRSTDPQRAADLCADAGAGAALERTRLDLWVASLERCAADAERWRRCIDQRLPAELAGRVLRGLARSLAAAGRVEEAAALLESAPRELRDLADETLLELGDGPWRQPAAGRLAAAAPPVLTRVAPDLERVAVASLSAEDRLRRAAGWRRTGRPEMAAAELRQLRWRGADEVRRRLELARCELAAGSPTRALRALPAGVVVEPLLVRAEAHRLRGWQRVPEAAAGGSFRDCLAAATRAAAAAGLEIEAHRRALQLVVECGTEGGSLDEALSAWFRLEGIGWSTDQRDWLGRRLGVALAERGGSAVAVGDLASSLPLHERCLRFWAALAATDGRPELERLAAEPLTDLYGGWSRQLLGRAAPTGLVLMSPTPPAEPPWSVGWLLERDAPEEAIQQWQRIAAARGTTRGEALAAARLSVELGRHGEAIGWLLASFPGLGTTGMDREPSNAVHLYLPLRFEGALRAAAAESGVEPWLLAGVARQESLFGAHARSPRGAIGLLQLRPDTALMHARALGLGRDPDLYDPQTNIRIGARELERLIKRFGALEPALAAYNAGETRVRGWWRRWGDRRRFTEAIPIPETYNYVRRVTYLTEAYRLVYGDVWRSQS